MIIDDFKGAICDSLQEYSQNITELQTEMEGAYDDARAIREEIQKFKSRHILAKASDKCAICKGFLLTRPFHLFVCGHKFHTECLIAGVLSNVNATITFVTQASLRALGLPLCTGLRSNL